MEIDRCETNRGFDCQGGLSIHKSFFFLLPADLRISDDEQHTFAVGLPRARLRSGIDMELLIGSSGYSHSLHSHGRLR